MTTDSGLSWYAVHAVLLIELKSQTQNSFSVWENIYVVFANSPEEAKEKGATIAKSYEGDSQGSFTWKEEPATFVYKGIRKVISVEGASLGQERIEDGSEVTYNEFEFETLMDLEEFLNQRPTKTLVI